MNVLDVVIILAAIAYGIGGFRNGAVVGLFSMTGFFGGAILGAQLAGPLGSRLANGRAQIPVAIVCVLFVAMLGQLLGVWIAGHIKRRIVKDTAQAVDSGIGSVLGVLSVFVVAWMVAVPLASSPYPSLSAEASHSRIVRTVNDVMPKDVRTLYSSLRTFLDQSGFPPVLGDLPSTSIINVPPPDPSLSPAVRARVQQASASIFKIYGEAPSCSRGIEGTGFVYAPHRIVTNAHVVAGTTQVGVQVSKSVTLPATVVVYDPRRDVAVLNVPSLNAPALPFSSTPASRGDPAVVLGYPEDGPFTVKTARVRSRNTIQGNDIYGNPGVRRDIYSIRAVVRSGNSGGPLLADNGSVLGVVFATALDSSDTGYVLTDSEIAPDISAGRSATTPVSTERCTPG
ncbi:MAG: Colicin production protein [Pseudonocardiales bacterium]|nr:Colicin production protein [Pseudonocardiales bacterium]